MAPPPITTALTNVLTVSLMGPIGPNGGPGTEADNLSLDRMIIPHLYSHVHEDYQYLVEDQVSATAAFKSLKGHFEKSNMTNRIVGRAELNAVRHDPSRISPSTPDLLLINLHPSYSSVRTVLLPRAAEPTLKDVTDLLTASAADP
ncbi:hypothetical protein R3P38DRAFT_3275819, partial [Favolaschia claudopus]